MIRLARPISPRLQSSSSLLPSSSLSPSPLTASSSSSTAAAASWCVRHRRSIVTRISPTTSLLRSNANENEIYLLGTAHVSDESTREVIELINLVQPTTVFVELDSGRAAQLRRSSAGSSTTTTTFDLSSITKHPMFASFASAIPGLSTNLAQVLQTVAPDILRRISWLPSQGGEMLAAITEADRLGIRCVHGDVEISQTMTEMKSAVSTSFAEITSNPTLISNLLPPPELRVIFGRLLSGKIDPRQFVESIKTRDNAHQVASYLQLSFPSVYNVMITKRDVHMAMMLRRHCGKGKVVAVVGMAHMEGIEREWEKLDTSSNN